MVIWYIHQAENSFDDISGKVVADFGCGCGTLAIASALLDAELVCLNSSYIGDCVLEFFFTVVSSRLISSEFYTP
jgi:hypothetical protein